MNNQEVLTTFKSVVSLRHRVVIITLVLRHF